MNKKLRVAINGFGRIGRNVLRAYLEYHDKFDDIEIIAINDIAEPNTLLHLLKFDSTHGRLSNIGVTADIAAANDNYNLILENQNNCLAIRLLNQKNPEQLLWQALDIDVVLECTGRFRSYQDASKHLQAGAKQVIIGAAPFDNVDASVVVGVNDEILSKKLPIISGVSCTTQALVPLLWLLDNQFGLDSVMMTEIHAVTADQAVLDIVHRDLRRARAAGHNIIPTTSSSIAAVGRVLPQLSKKINGHSIRVPTLDVAAIDVTFILKQNVDVKILNDTLQNASQTILSGIMGYSDEPLVSSDFVHDSHSLVIDSLQTMAIGRQLKIFAWYDNEWGYANRLLEMCKKIAKN